MNRKMLVRNGVALLISMAFVLGIGGSRAAGDSIYHYATGCPQEEQDCEFSWYECVDWDARLRCTIPTAIACEAVCIVCLKFNGFACSAGCAYIAFEVCKFCEEMDLHFYCYCPGDPMESPSPLPDGSPGNGAGGH